MAEIALLGYGTVGSGVAEVLKINALSIHKKAAQPIQIKYILEKRSFPGDPMERFITFDINDILNDNDISVVVEVMGGTEPAYTYVKKALLRGKSVVTSNKELVAAHGAELLALARERNINFLFEASVGGGIPIIRSLNKSLTADEITEITGILNGTTNYILTKMTKEAQDFDIVLREAQQKGYAEQNPSADIDGFDSCRKIAILLSLAFGKHINYEDIYTEGIRTITQTDIQYARKMGHVIKLLATAKIENYQVFACVAPVMVDAQHPLAGVHDVFNAIFVKGNVLGDVMFYGPGAGKLPTASAVIADIVEAVLHLKRNIMHFWSEEKTEMLDILDVKCRMFVRVSASDIKQAQKSAGEVFNANEFIEALAPGEFGLVTGLEAERDIRQKIKALEQKPGINHILNTIRLER